MNLVKTSYPESDVTILLQDVRGKVPVLDTAEREKLNQQGVHYSEMLPLEYAPTERYMKIYQESLATLSFETANAIASLSEKIFKKKRRKSCFSFLSKGRDSYRYSNKKVPSL